MKNICCSVCLDDIISNKLVLSCGHTFHTNCIFKWFCINNKCPLCCGIIKNTSLEKMKLKALVDDFDKEFNANKHILIKLKRKELLVEKQRKLIELES